MLREAQIPFLLWLPTAIIMHVLGGGGAIRAAQLADDQARLLAFTTAVRAELDQALAGTETTVELIKEPTPEPPEEKGAAAAAPAATVDPQAPPTLPEPIAPQAPPEKPKVAKKEAEKKAEESPDKEAASQEPPKHRVVPVPKDGRLAIQNDPDLDKDQDDNPEAGRIADHAHHTDDETMARIRSYDQNSPKPTAAVGETHDPTDDKPGDHDEDSPGFTVEKDDPEEAPRAGSEAGPKAPTPEEGRRRLEQPPKAGHAARAAQTGARAQEKGEGRRTSSATGNAQGAWRMAPAAGDNRPKQEARRAKRGRAARPAAPGLSSPRLPARYRLDAHGVREALGAKSLREDQERARNTRMAKHRGRFKNADFRRFRAAIENYDPTVKPGNQTSLNAARVPFAAYINRMHNRIHPIFADRFLRSLEKLPGADALQNLKLVTHVELVLDKERGRLIRSGITKPSGVTAFEVAALRSLEQAAPFGPAPDAIISPDGKVYVHWEFYRNPYYACTSRFARPYILKHPPDTAPTPEPPAPPLPPPSADERYGQRGPVRRPRAQP